MATGRRSRRDQKKKGEIMVAHIALRATRLAIGPFILGTLVVGICGLFGTGCELRATGPARDSSAEERRAASAQTLGEARRGQLATSSGELEPKMVSTDRTPGGLPRTSMEAATALDMARLVFSQGRHELATYYYLNVINADPTNAHVLLEYGTLVEEIASGKEKEGKISEAAELLEKLASLFYGQALQVDWKFVETVVAKATEYQKWAESLREKEYTSVTSGGDNQKWEELKQKLMAGQPPAVPESPEAAEKQLREWEPLLPVARANAAPGDEQAVKWLEDHLKVLQAVLAFHRGKSIVNEYLSDAKGESSPTVSAMILQQAELTLRELTALKAVLPPALAEEVRHLARQLSEAALEVSNLQAKESSEKAWSEFLKDRSIESRIDDIKKWEPPKEIEADAACTRKLEDLEALMREIQAMIPLLSDFQVREKAVSQLEGLSKEAERISKVRQNRYCQWALQKIKLALEMFEKNKGWLNDNEVKFGEALIDQLGEIDESLLTFETRRCYSEAFETIFGELGKVRSTDLERQGTKMYVLKGMLEKEKKTYRDF